jgi:hypothetical protein
MSKSKAPDTRGKLDSQRDLNPRKVTLVKKGERKEQKTTLEKFQKKAKQNEKQKAKDASPLKLSVEKKESKGSIFKKQHGYSKTTKRLLHTYGETLDQYRIRRKNRKLAERKVRQKKHADSAAYKRAHGKTKGSKGSKPAPKKVAVKAAA